MTDIPDEVLRGWRETAARIAGQLRTGVDGGNVTRPGAAAVGLTQWINRYLPQETDETLHGTQNEH